ncbi:MAG: TetR/AcrR family transcriptional regulator [Anaerolineae bacterium]|nr:TetR/AcrR family transcriptional regulator [Anaerolineae bacterium]
MNAQSTQTSQPDSAAEGFITTPADWGQLHGHILQLEQQGVVTRTFRRLDPDRQLAIITAILDEAIAKGPASLNIKQVAERAGVSVGSLYTYFSKREGLLVFAVELCTRYLTDMFDSYRPYLAALPLREALTAFLRGGVEWGQMQTGLVQFFARAAYHGEPALTEQVVRPIANVMLEMVRAMLVQAVASGEVREEIDLEATTRVIYALIVAIGDSQLLPYLNVYFQVTNDKVSLERVTKALMALLVHGIGVAE